MLAERKLFFQILLLFYFLSGLFSLSYEILWVRMLSLKFGVSIFGVVVTVCVFMLGLGAGSLFAAKYASRSVKPLLWFASIEALVGIFALAIPPLFSALDNGFIFLAQQTDLMAWYFLQFVVTGLILTVPAFFMGAGFPFILRLFKGQVGNLEYVYGINTLGATMGAMAPLVLLPAFGWASAVNIIAGGSLCVAALSGLMYLLAKRAPVPVQPDTVTTQQSVPWVMLAGYAGIGATALILEIAWTRFFGMIFLRTEYVIAIILAIFLLGIGIGSIIARKIKSDYWLQLLPVHASVLIVAGLWLLPFSVTWIEPNSMRSLQEALLNQGIIIFLLTFPVTLIFGAWLPLLNRKFGASGLSGARLYGANSVGAAVGALGAGFVFIPSIGSTATIVLAAMLIILFSLAWADTKKLICTLPLLVIIGIPVMKMPEVKQLMPFVYQDTKDIYRYEDAVNITHVIEKKDGQRLLLGDLQRMDAASDPASVESQRNQARLPILLHPNPQTVLFLGLGTAITASATKQYPGLSRTAVELSKGAINAAEEFFDKVNLDIMETTTVIRDDARHYLMSTVNRYDVIVGDLFHPDLVGRSALLSVQQFSRVKSRLTDNGVYVQWLALNQFEPQSLEIILRTFKKVFPNGVIFLDAFRLALVGGKSGFPGAEIVQQNISRLTEDQADSITGGEGYWTWLGRYWGPVVAGDGVVQDEWKPQIEFKLPMARYNGDLDLSRMLEFMLSIRPHVNEAAKLLKVNDSEFAKFERAYAGTELAMRSWLALLYNKSGEGQRLLKLAFQANPDDKWIGFAVADAAIANFDLNPVPEVSEKQLLESVLKIRPDHPEALKRLWQLSQSNERLESMYRERLQQLSPYDINMQSYTGS